MTASHSGTVPIRFSHTFFTDASPYHTNLFTDSIPSGCHTNSIPLCRFRRNIHDPCGQQSTLRYEISVAAISSRSGARSGGTRFYCEFAAVLGGTTTRAGRICLQTYAVFKAHFFGLLLTIGDENNIDVLNRIPCGRRELSSFPNQINIQSILF